MTDNPQVPSAARREEIETWIKRKGTGWIFWDLIAFIDAQSAERTAREFDANVDRLKACEHIADGDEGWESLRNECPSTAAVA